ncbi:hypothetical protein ACH4FX_19060 [Streptomyces sp. NPDC018019]|uniref:hypothetical protein n=1 Tax=Streptomyces sp. NPDC018019 TaxID=3365030 RepID=UPI00379FAD2D
MMSATSTLAVTHFVTLADSFDKDKVTPGVLGFIVFAVIGGAVWLLMKSMNKQMKKVDFEESPEAPAASGGTEAAKGSAKGRTSGKAQPKTG